MLTVDWSDSLPTRTRAADSSPAANWLGSVRRLWCRHAETVVTPKTSAMPAHVVCTSCGWREPLVANRPLGVRTWDSSRDEVRYAQEKQRRAALEERRQMIIAETALSTSQQAVARRRVRANLIELKRIAGS